MRSLAAALTTAQQSASREPYVECSIENTIAGIRRLDFAVIDQTANTLSKHDVAACPADGSVTRVRCTGGNVLYQRNTSPGSAAGYAAAWTTLASGKGTEVAVASLGARVIIAYTDAAGTGIKMRESTDNGATYAAEVAVATVGSAVADLAAAYKTSGGDHAIAYVRNNTTIGILVRTAGTYAGAVETAPGTATLTGIAMSHAFDWEMAITGTEVTTTHKTLWSLVRGDGGLVTAGTWSTFQIQLQAETDALVAYQAPSLVYTDTWRIYFTEDDTFTGGFKRAYWSFVPLGQSFHVGSRAWRAPLPYNYSATNGVAVAIDSLAGYVYVAAPDYVARAPHPVARTTYTTQLIAADVREELYATRGTIDIDISDGVQPTALSLQLGNLVTVKWGYYTTSGYLSSTMQDLWITGYESRSAGRRRVLRLAIEGGWETLARARQRGQIVHATDTYIAVLTRIFQRAGFTLTQSASSARASAIIPAFTIAADADAASSVRRALAYLADRIRWENAAAAVVTEPLASAASTYTFGGAHGINELIVAVAAPASSEIAVTGAAAWGEALDYANAGQGVGTREQVRDQSSVTGAAATNTATAHLRQRALDVAGGSLVCPPHCGAELLDVVDFTDAWISGSATKRRIEAIRWRYDRHRAIYEQTLTLGAP